jgi:antitoxin PrlF
MGTYAMSKLTSKYQTTIPGPVREALGLSKGDTLAFDVADDGAVTVRKATPLDLEFSRALEPLLSEWATEQDEKAYREL